MGNNCREYRIYYKFIAPLRKQSKGICWDLSANHLCIYDIRSSASLDIALVFVSVWVILHAYKFLKEG